MLTTEKLKKHLLLFVGVLIIGIYGIAPQLLYQDSLGEEYNGIYLANTSDELYYHSRVQEFFDGHPGLGNSYIFEHKEDPFVQPPLPEAIIFGFGKLTGLQGIDLAIIGYKIVFPILLFIVLYLLFLQFSRGNRWLSFLFGLCIILATNLVVNPRDLLGLVGIGSFDNYNQIYLRPVNPQISSLFFFLYVLFFYLALNKSKNIYIFLAGLFFGGSFYAYPYTWTFILTLNAVLFIFNVIQKESKSNAIIAKTTLWGIIVSLPYWWLLWQSMQSEAFAFAANTNGIRFTRQPIFSKIVLLSSIVFTLASVVSKKFFNNSTSKFIGAMIVSGWIVINQQVITGRELFHGHYHVFYNIPVLALTVFYVLNFFKKSIPKFAYHFIIGICFFGIVVNGVLTIQNVKDKIFPVFKHQQKYGPVVDWINNNTNPDDVIVTTDMELNSFIPAYTKANILTAFPATWFLVSPEEIRHRYFIYLTFLGVEPTEKSYRDHLQNEPIEPLTIGGAFLTEVDHNCPQCVTDELVEEISSEYQIFSAVEFRQHLQRYRLDYAVIPLEISDRFNYSFLTVVNTDDQFVYYEFEL